MSSDCFGLLRIASDCFGLLLSPLIVSLIRCDEFWSYNAEFQACGAQCALLIGGVLHLKPEHLQSFAMRFPNMRRVKHGASPGEFNGLFMLTDEQRQTQALRLLANCNVRAHHPARS